MRNTKWLRRLKCWYTGHEPKCVKAYDSTAGIFKCLRCDLKYSYSTVSRVKLKLTEDEFKRHIRMR